MMNGLRFRSAPVAVPQVRLPVFPLMLPYLSPKNNQLCFCAVTLLCFCVLNQLCFCVDLTTVSLFDQDYSTETNERFSPSPHDQGAVVTIRGRDDTVPADSHWGVGRWSWHWMPPLTPEELQEGLHLTFWILQIFESSFLFLHFYAWY
jgi:hypothetical protein